MQVWATWNDFRTASWIEILDDPEAVVLQQANQLII